MAIIRLIFKGCEQTGPDAYADSWHTLDVHITGAQSDEVLRLVKAATLAGVTVVGHAPVSLRPTQEGA